jgi:hypothetical protein
MTTGSIQPGSKALGMLLFKGGCERKLRDWRIHTHHEHDTTWKKTEEPSRQRDYERPLYTNIRLPS